MDRDEEVAASGLDAWEHRRMRHEGTGIHRIFIHRPRPTLTRRHGWLAWLDRGDEVVGPVGKVDLGDPKVGDDQWEWRRQRWLDGTLIKFRVGVLFIGRG